VYREKFRKLLIQSSQYKEVGRRIQNREKFLPIIEEVGLIRGFSKRAVTEKLINKKRKID